MEDYKDIYKIEKARQVNQLEIYKVREDLFVKQNLLKTYLQEAKNKVERYNQIYIQIKEQKNIVNCQNVQKKTSPEVLISRLKEHKNRAILAKDSVAKQEKTVAQSVKEACQLKNREVLLTKMFDKQNLINETRAEQIQNDEAVELYSLIKEKDKIDSLEVEPVQYLSSDIKQVESYDTSKNELEPKSVDPNVSEHASKHHDNFQGEHTTQVVQTSAETLNKWQVALKNYTTGNDVRHAIVDGKSVLEIDEMNIGNNKFAITISDKGSRSVSINICQHNRSHIDGKLNEECKAIVGALESEGIKVESITIYN